MELFPELFSSKSLNAPCAFIWQLNFPSCFSHLSEQSTVVSSGTKALREICKTNYESIIVMAQFIKQLGVAGSDLLGERVLNFSYSTSATKKQTLEQSTAEEPLIIIITGNTTKFILKVKEPLEKSSNSPWCIVWIILLLLSTKSSQKREKPGILWFLVGHRTPLEAHLTAVMCPAISDLSRRMLNTSLMS